MNWLRGGLILAVLGMTLGPILMTGVPLSVVGAEFWGSTFGEPRGWALMLREFGPLLLAGLAVWVALQAGLFNIGAEGQILIGGVCCVSVALAIPGPFGLLLATLAGAVGGALWAYPAGYLRVKFGSHEVIATIMLNQLALLLTSWLTKNPLRNPDQMAATTRRLGEQAPLPPVASWGRAELDWIIVLTLALIVGTWWYMRRRVGGYELRLVGASVDAAEHAGVNVGRMRVMAMAVSGALAGLAGALMVLGDQNRFYEDFAAGRGFNALGVALLAGGNPLTIIPMAGLFAALSAGTTGLALTGIPKGLNGLLLGGLIMIFGALAARRRTAHE